MKKYLFSTLRKRYRNSIIHASGKNPDPKYRITPLLVVAAKEITDDLKRKYPVPLIRRFPSVLGTLSSWYAYNAVSELADGMEPYPSLGIYLECLEIRMKLAIAWGDMSKGNIGDAEGLERPYEDYPEPNCALATLMVFNRWKFVKWLGKNWLANRGTYFGDWHDTPFNAYMARLHLIHAEGADPTGKFPGLPAIGPYAGMFRHWNDPEKLRKPILAACQYHLDQCRVPGKARSRWMTEFYFEPYDAIPMEILAYRAVREKMGLETPLPSHPILDTPFVENLPKKVPHATDKNLDRIIAAVREKNPGIL